MEFHSEVSLLCGFVLVAKRRSIGGFGRICSPSSEGIVFNFVTTWTSAAGTDSGYCSWSGVLCNANSRVVAVNVTGNGGNRRNGTSHPCKGFSQFPLYGFGVRRTCEGGNSRSNLRKLRVLNLGFNKIVGEIPGSISSLESLEVLNLAGNGLNGSVPGFVERLRGVYLSFNQFSGVVPREIGENCWKLEHLDLSAVAEGGERLGRWCCR
ncbi:uncharacterized protein HKW66_Vig0232110 [Vigna angularis]|uniref:Leucine-rich repeat-containing N-terminal plant-type domain-containing protein n=1 Tax=Phaseolus angularis TaxID=3914 RepID=A0A8T0KBD8_PHAAN|nr:uncharacterized protein HKW66_Vig0232110 [Vigna angularis]